PSEANRIKAGRQDLESLDGFDYVSQFVVVELSNGDVAPLTKAPIGSAAGWTAAVQADWSFDGRSVVLSNTFLPESTPSANRKQNRPCVAIVELATHSMTCVERIKGSTATGYEEGWHFVDDVRFAPQDNERILVYYYQQHGLPESTIYARSANGSWVAKSTVKNS